MAENTAKGFKLARSCGHPMAWMAIPKAHHGICAKADYQGLKMFDNRTKNKTPTHHERGFSVEIISIVVPASLVGAGEPFVKENYSLSKVFPESVIIKYEKTMFLLFFIIKKTFSFSPHKTALIPSVSPP